MGQRKTNSIITATAALLAIVWPECQPPWASVIAARHRGELKHGSGAIGFGPNKPERKAAHELNTRSTSPCRVKDIDLHRIMRFHDLWVQVRAGAAVSPQEKASVKARTTKQPCRIMSGRRKGQYNNIDLKNNCILAKYSIRYLEMNAD